MLLPLRVGLHNLPGRGRDSDCRLSQFLPAIFRGDDDRQVFDWRLGVEPVRSVRTHVSFM